VFKMESNSIGAGMGTSGLVGQFGTIAAMSETTPMVELLLKMGVLHFILPAILSLVISEFMRKRGMIKLGDMKLHS